MIDVLVFFIGASLWLYVLLGGSDYGAGILELLPAGGRREAQKHVINEAMGPVWEANHIWLILVIVVLFVGFPTIFTTLMVALHIPMLALLVGIVVRGTAFTFRHYDAIQAPGSQRVYTLLFGVSSLWAALWLGIIVASLNRGLIVARVGGVAGGGGGRGLACGRLTSRRGGERIRWRWGFSWRVFLCFWPAFI